MITTRVDELFDPALLRRLEALSLLARRMTKGQQRAERRSQRRGASVEFAEFRAFVPGDDWRHIDWHAFARWRQLVLKLFVEEEDLHVHLLLDCTGSMDLGGPAKFDYARQVVGGLGYLSLANLDRVSVTALGNEGYGRWMPARGRLRILQLLRYLAGCPVASDTVRLEASIQRWLSGAPRSGLAVWVSDLFGADREDAFRALDRLRYARHQVAVLQVMDPSETQAGALGEFELRELETGERRRVIVDHRAAAEFKARFEEYQEKLRRYCTEHQISLLQTETSVPVADLLMRTLREGGVVA